MNIGTLEFQKKFVKRGTSRFLCCGHKGHPGFRYYDPVFTNAKLIFVKTEPRRFLCLPAGRDQVSDIIDSDPHECVGIFVKTEPHRFLCCLPINRETQVSDIIDSDPHECKRDIREDGTTQVSLSPPDRSG
jgi:hypothetical protein